MATTPTDPFGWLFNNNNRYLRFCKGELENNDGILEFTGTDPCMVFTPEFSSGNSRYLNIKHCRSNLYITRAPNQRELPFSIVATAKTPNENRVDEDCTLFELFEVRKVGPTNDTPVVRMRHVQSNCYLRPHKFKGMDVALCAVSRDHDPGEVDLFTIIRS